MTFADLKFEPHPVSKAGVQALVFFANGYGASVIRTETSYGGRHGLYEVAVLRGTGPEDFDIDSTTAITDDVLGWQSENDVTAVLRGIEAFPPAEAASDEA